MNTKLIRGQCEICNEDILPAKSQAQFNRNLGLHRRRAHQIASPKYEEHRHYRQQRRKNQLAKVMATNGNHEDDSGFQALLSAPQRQNRRRRLNRSRQIEPSPLPTSPLPPIQEDTSANAIPAKLSECPCCGTRFYMVKGGQ